MRDHNHQRPVYLLTVHDALKTDKENKEALRKAQEYLRANNVSSKVLFSAAGAADHDCEYLVIPEEGVDAVNEIAVENGQDTVIYLNYIREAYSRSVPVQPGVGGWPIGELKAIAPGAIVAENERTFTDVNHNTRFRIL